VLAGCGDSRSPHRISNSAGKDGGFRLLVPLRRGPAVVVGIRAGDRETGGSEAETSNPNHDGAMGQRRWDGGGGG
jgi:hypothetical protein